MNAFPPTNGRVPGANGGPVPVPAGSHRGPTNGHGSRGGAPFEGPRSPPNKNSTAHVPCKFFRQGACQAGKACPFMHSTEPTIDTAPCKYFQKGNCKFGAKCALAHILPNGVRVNRPNYGGGGPGGASLNFGGRVPHNVDGPPPGMSLLSMQAQMVAPPGQGYPYAPQDDAFGPPRSQYDMVPTIDTTFSSLPNSNYGSPPTESRLGVSPIQKKGLSVLDVPLPSSFDSQGVSTFARYGPIAASVPSRFGIESASPASYQSKAIGESTTLRNLHNSAFGEDPRPPNNAYGSSPPATEEPSSRRMLHSERFSRQKVMSASVPRPPGPLKDLGDEWEQNFAFEEDCIPSSIAGDVLTPQERNRRSSRTDDETLQSHRMSLSGLGTPVESGSKVGSPMASSPSRFGPLFSRNHKPEGGEGSPFSGGSAFGHVGSPLRNSALHPGASPSLRAVSKPPGSGDISPFVSSPPRQASMSIITQQLQRTRLQTRASSGSNVNEAQEASGLSSLHPGIARVASGSSVGSSPAGRLDRAVSSSSIGRSERIDEEQGLFSMEDEEEMEKKKDGNSTSAPVWSHPPSSTTGKRFSGGWGGLPTISAGKPSTTSAPSLTPIGAKRSNGTTPSGDKENSNTWTNGE